MRRISNPLAIAILGLVIVTAAGCKMIEKHKALETERMLSAAGFQMKLASTPEKQAQVEAMTQRMIVPHDRDGQTFFVYADGEDCKCVYVGNQTNFQEYQKLMQQQNIADQEAMTAAMNEDATMNWGTWGAFRPWY